MGEDMLNLESIELTETSSSPETECLFVVIGYRRPDLVLNFLGSLLVQDLPTWGCVVVDNSASDPDLRAALRGVDDERVVSVAAPGNLGYFPGADFALRSWTEAGLTLPRWVVICNQDLVIQPDFVARLHAFAFDTGRVWCLAPRVWDATTGGDVNPYMAERPRISKQLVVALMSLTSRSYAVLASRYDRNELVRAESRRQEGPRDIYAAHGSLVCVSREFFTAGGSLSRRRRLFGEEVFLAEQMARLGARTVYLPSLRAVHEAHATTDSSDFDEARAIMAERRAASWGIVLDLTKAVFRRDR